MHITCEKDSLLASVSPEIVYYDDEELDRFTGRSPEDFSDQEIGEFAISLSPCSRTTSPDGPGAFSCATSPFLLPYATN